eukprot:249419-Hanusia_phi.AAC.1
MADESVGHTNSRAAMSRCSTCTRARASFLANPEAAGTVNSVTIGEVLSDSNCLSNDRRTERDSDTQP